MALQSQVWSPATPMPMAESSLYRQRLEVIAEKRRLQEEIRSARRELEEEKLRVERLKRKSLRERWLMDGAAEGPERPEEPTSRDPQSPEGQAQARIRHLEDSLLTLQSQLQLLQSASTGAQHKPSGRPTWRRQGHRPLSLPTVEASPAGYTDLNKRTSLPAGPLGTSPESPSESRDEAAGVLPARRPVLGAAGGSSEANGPCPGPSPPPEQEPRQEVAASQGGAVVKVVWEGLGATKDCATGATGPELEAKVEAMVLEAVTDRQEARCPELPSWVKEDRGVVEVVWEGVGGTRGGDSAAPGQAGRGPESARLQEGLEEEGIPRGSPDGDGQGASGGEEGSFIWVERVTLSEEWEELVVEGSAGSQASVGEGGAASPRRAGRGRGAGPWEVERSRAEASVGASEQKAGAEAEGAEMPPAGERRGRRGSSAPERRGGEKLGTDGEGGGEPLSADREEGEGPLGAEGESGEEPLGVEQEGGEGKLEAEEPSGAERQGDESLRAEEERGEEELGAEQEVEEPLGVEHKGDEGSLQATGAPLVTERRGSAGSLKAERTGGEEPLQAERMQGVKEDLSPEEQSEPGGGREGQADEVSEAGAPLGSEEEGRWPPEKQEGSLEEEAVRPQTPVEGPGPLGVAAPLLVETPAPEQPAECQPLLQVEGPRANPRAHPVPTYAPTRRSEPPAPPEGEAAGGAKQKTCQCCAVM
ncbi:paralemmin-3 [Diceros bicornis minor]|uniref:paralemmin-3 n=1 Tax=Diceros bicornis minor TaxID=77932 RepID=UPI0026E97D96|nr:paralemmin-3 [Diceros bicornis minor]